jgi:hypothetical protein
MDARCSFPMGKLVEVVKVTIHFQFLPVVERDEFICTCVVNVKYCSSIGVVG